MLEQGIIEPSTSPWASSIVLVHKSDGSFRCCVDYRKVNALTHQDAYPSPRIDDTLDYLGVFQFFSSLNLQSGYWQVPVARKDREKTAFICPQGLYQFQRMPFRLTNALATFRLMNEVLRGLTPTINSKMIHRINALEMWVIRRMLRISYTEHRTNASVLEELGRTPQLMRSVASRKMKYFGYIARHATILRDIMTGKAPGRRPRGRPRRTWLTWTNITDINALFSSVHNCSLYRAMTANPHIEDGT